MDAIAFQGDEPVWSANIKRGVAALFQVNLDHSYAANPNMDKGMRFDPIQPSYTVWEVCGFVSVGFSVCVERIVNDLVFFVFVFYELCILLLADGVGVENQ